MLLAADVGGTKTNIALCALPDRHGALPRLLHRATYASADHSGLEAIVEHFLGDLGAERPARIDAACFGVAGPVLDTHSETPNLPWVIDGATIAHRFGIRSVELVNDLVATAIRAATLGSDDLEVLHPGTPNAPGPGNRVVVAAGTGLGVAQLVRAAGRYTPVPSEGGHVCFAPRNREEFALLEFLARRHGRVSVERAVSGRGLASIYEFILERGEPAPDPDLRRAVLADPEHAARLVAEHGQSGDCRAASRALDLFIELYGAAAGNFALTALATGGVLLGGGIAPKLLTALRRGRFLEAFFDKGRFAPLMHTIPVYVIEDPETALFGAALEAARLAGTTEEGSR
jgi:glucokinase